MNATVQIDGLTKIYTFLSKGAPSVAFVFEDESTFFKARAKTFLHIFLDKAPISYNWKDPIGKEQELYERFDTNNNSRCGEIPPKNVEELYRRVISLIHQNTEPSI